jgi:hypothetical protein
MLLSYSGKFNGVALCVLSSPNYSLSCHSFILSILLCYTLKLLIDKLISLRTSKNKGEKKSYYY